MNRPFRYLALLLACAPAFADYPALTTEITPEHPLFLFSATAPGAPAAEYAAGLTEAWSLFPAELKPYSALIAQAPQVPATERLSYFQEALAPIQAAGIPVVVRIDGATPADGLSPEQVEALISAFTVVAGLETSTPRFDVYPAPGQPQTAPPGQEGLIALIETAARYGRFVHVPLADTHWPRMMANSVSSPLYSKFQACADYVVPSSWTRGQHTLVQQSALTGLWLEGAVNRWGLQADARWIVDAGFRQPGVYGKPGDIAAAQLQFYTAALYLGAMSGAQVYAFPRAEDLWMQDDPAAWDQQIYPGLKRLMALGAIARKEFVQKKAQVAYQLAPAANPAAFHANWADIDPSLNTGVMFQAAYAPSQPGRIAELVPDKSSRYLVPLLSPYATDAVRQGFAAMGAPGAYATLDAWAGVLDLYAQADGTGEAYVSRVGRGVFVFHARENDPRPESFSIPELPAPVGPISARREGGAINLEWPFREGDVSYAVHRRVPPAAEWSLLASGITERIYADVSIAADTAYAYAITALTNETAPYTGTVQHGEYVLLSGVESRIEQEVVMAPVANEATSLPPEAPAPALAAPADAAPAPAPEAPPAPTPQEVAQTAIVARLGEWQRAFEGANLEGVAALYDPAYATPQGWGAQDAKRAYEWFFRRYKRPLMLYQAREWDVAAAEQGTARVKVFVQLSGTALSDPLGILADQRVSLPLTPDAEVWITWAARDGGWFITATDPPLPDFAGLLDYSMGPYDQP
ncbi:MAG: hypothetical protein GC168_10575 [Candidatus Hydrogenedens sp.]|nr:hypothetical protein [Candidatus Hydrogenedens sp.]